MTHNHDNKHTRRGFIKFFINPCRAELFVIVMTII